MTFATTKPIPVPGIVDIQVKASAVTVKGPLGELLQEFDKQTVKITLDSGVLEVSALKATKHAKAIIGTLRSLIVNMITGVTSGFEKKLLLVGVGYRAQ